MSSLIPATTSSSSWAPVPSSTVAAPVNASGNPIHPRNIHLERGALPPEAIESNTNRQSRIDKETYYKKLDSPIPSERSKYRADFEKKYGKKWETARNTVREFFRSQQNTKKRQRWEAEKRFRNDEWFRYSNQYAAASQAQSLPPGVPRMGHPPRVVNGYAPYEPYTIPRGGKSKKRRTYRKSKRTRKTMRK